eukprot:g44571.t1
MMDDKDLMMRICESYSIVPSKKMRMFIGNNITFTILQCNTITCRDHYRINIWKVHLERVKVPRPYVTLLLVLNTNRKSDEVQPFLVRLFINMNHEGLFLACSIQTGAQLEFKYDTGGKKPQTILTAEHSCTTAGHKM